MKTEEQRARKIINSMAVTHRGTICDWDESDLAFVIAEILAAQREAEAETLGNCVRYLNRHGFVAIAAKMLGGLPSAYGDPP